MNERIKKLAEQSLHNVKFWNEQLAKGNTPPNGRAVTLDELEKFAELIVKECLGIVKSNIYGPAGEYDYSYSDKNAAADDRAETIYEEIAHRFGVE